MRTCVVAVVVGMLCLSTSFAKNSSAMVQVYSREPGEIGKDNILICHVSNFHPPEITIKLLKDGKEMPGAKQTDLAFGEKWDYHITKHVRFIPNNGEEYACSVTHMGMPRVYIWGMAHLLATAWLREAGFCEARIDM